MIKLGLWHIAKLAQKTYKFSGGLHASPIRTIDCAYRRGMRVFWRLFGILPSFCRERIEVAMAVLTGRVVLKKATFSRWSRRRGLSSGSRLALKGCTRSNRRPKHFLSQKFRSSFSFLRVFRGHVAQLACPPKFCFAKFWRVKFKSSHDYQNTLVARLRVGRFHLVPLEIKGGIFRSGGSV